MSGRRGAPPPAPRVAAPQRTRDNGPMTKSELIQRIAQKQPQIVERDVELAMKMMLDQMAACLAGGGRSATCNGPERHPGRMTNTLRIAGVSKR